MFTGIIQEIGTVKSIIRESRIILAINSPLLAKDAYLGGSISVNGTCLSITKIDGSVLYFDAIPETIQHTNLGDLKNGDFVNLEPAMQANSRFDGHIVQGHVDETGKIARFDKLPGEVRIAINTSTGFISRCIEKGSVAIDGISLTITKLIDEKTFEVAIIPTSLAETTLKYRKIGDTINLESDVMLKYIARIINKTILNSENLSQSESKINENWLRSLGF